MAANTSKTKQLLQQFSKQSNKWAVAKEALREMEEDAIETRDALTGTIHKAHEAAKTDAEKAFWATLQGDALGLNLSALSAREALTAAQTIDRDFRGVLKTLADEKAEAKAKVIADKNIARDAIKLAKLNKKATIKAKADEKKAQAAAKKADAKAAVIAKRVAAKAAAGAKKEAASAKKTAAKVKADLKNGRGLPQVKKVPTKKPAAPPPVTGQAIGESAADTKRPATVKKPAAEHKIEGAPLTTQAIKENAATAKPKAAAKPPVQVTLDQAIDKTKEEPKTEPILNGAKTDPLARLAELKLPGLNLQ